MLRHRKTPRKEAPVISLNSYCAKYMSPMDHQRIKNLEEKEGFGAVILRGDSGNYIKLEDVMNIWASEWMHDDVINYFGALLERSLQPGTAWKIFTIYAWELIDNHRAGVVRYELIDKHIYKHIFKQEFKMLMFPLSTPTKTDGSRSHASLLAWRNHEWLFYNSCKNYPGHRLCVSYAKDVGRTMALCSNTDHHFFINASAAVVILFVLRPHPRIGPSQTLLYSRTQSVVCLSPAHPPISCSLSEEEEDPTIPTSLFLVLVRSFAIQVLQFNSTNLGNEGAKAVAELLKEKPALRFVELNYNVSDVTYVANIHTLKSRFEFLSESLKRITEVFEH